VLLVQKSAKIIFIRTQRKAFEFSGFFLKIFRLCNIDGADHNSGRYHGGLFVNEVVAEKHSKGELSIFICSFRHKQLHLNVSMPLYHHSCSAIRFPNSFI